MATYSCGQDECSGKEHGDPAFTDLSKSLDIGRFPRDAGLLLKSTSNMMDAYGWP